MASAGLKIRPDLPHLRPMNGRFEHGARLGQGRLHGGVQLAAQPLVPGEFEAALGLPQNRGRKSTPGRRNQQRFPLAAVQFPAAREQQRVLRHPMVEQRNTNLERMGHAHRVRIAQQRIPQVDHQFEAGYAVHRIVPGNQPLLVLKLLGKNLELDLQQPFRAQHPGDLPWRKQEAREVKRVRESVLTAQPQGHLLSPAAPP